MKLIYLTNEQTSPGRQNSPATLALPRQEVCRLPTNSPPKCPAVVVLSVVAKKSAAKTPPAPGAKYSKCKLRCTGTINETSPSRASDQVDAVLKVQATERNRFRLIREALLEVTVTTTQELWRRRTKSTVATVLPTALLAGAQAHRLI